MGAFLYFTENNRITKVTFKGVSQRKPLYFVEETVGPEPIKCKGTRRNMQFSPWGTLSFCFVLF